MDISRPSSPEEAPQDLWSSILDSVSSSRSIPAKQILVLGEPSSGKSTLTSSLLQKKPEDNEAQQDFAIGYDWADVKDEEDTLARLSVYTVPSSSSLHMSLVPHFLPPRSSLPHTLIMIVLDWTKPWTFVDQLQTWLRWLDTWVKGDGSHELEVVREEGKERLLYFWQHYTEPSADALPSTSTLNSTILPLGSGTLTHNSSGVPIVVVCSKADLIDEGHDAVGVGASGMGGMVKGKGSEWEERTDSIMQVLRVVCLKYGAALFYTTPSSQTLVNLRQYALHLLFAPPAPGPGAASADGATHHRNPFKFSEKPNILDRDRILVPAGWDSWGKIAVLRDGFDAKTWNEAWDRDFGEGSGNAREASAKALYASLVPYRGPKLASLPPFNEPVPEQTFLGKHYEENAKKPDRDPRAAFRNTPDASGAGIVGPMGASTFSLPTVERALGEMEGGNSFAASVGPDGRKASRRDVPSRSSAAQSTSSTRPGSASPLSTTNQAGAPSQHEVLQNFFNSLLNSRERGAASPAVSRVQSQQNGASETPVSEANGTGSGAE